MQKWGQGDWQWLAGQLMPAVSVVLVFLLWKQQRAEGSVAAGWCGSMALEHPSLAYEGHQLMAFVLGASRMTIPGVGTIAILPGWDALWAAEGTITHQHSYLCESKEELMFALPHFKSRFTPFIFSRDWSSVMLMLSSCFPLRLWDSKGK